MVTPWKDCNPLEHAFFQWSCKRFDFSGLSASRRGYYRRLPALDAGFISHDAEGAGANYVHDAGIVINMLQHGFYRLYLGDLATASLVFHALKFIVERQLLVVVKVSQAAAIFQSCRYTLEDCGQLLHRGLGRIIVFGRCVLLPVAVGQLLRPGKGQLLVAGIDLSREVVRLGGQIGTCGCGLRPKELNSVW